MGIYTDSSDQVVEQFWGDLVKTWERVQKERPPKVFDIHPKPTTEWGKDQLNKNYVTSLQVNLYARHGMGKRIRVQ